MELLNAIKLPLNEEANRWGKGNRFNDHGSGRSFNDMKVYRQNR